MASARGRGRTAGGHVGRTTRQSGLVVWYVCCALTGGQVWAQSPPTPTWKGGTTTVTFGRGEIALSNRLQIRWTDERDDQDTARPVELVVRRARSKVEGWVGTKNVSYEIEVDYAAGLTIVDAFLNWDPSGSDALQVRLGQFKVPFGRERLTSSGKRQLVDRSDVSGDFTDGRDIGVQLWGRLSDGLVEYRAGAFNGNGRGVLGNPDGRRQYDARLMVQPFGKVGYDEGDFDSRPRPRLAVGANVEVDDNHGATDGNDLRRRVIGVDAAVKHRGRSAVLEYFSGHFEPESGVPLAARGLLLQGGWFVVPARVEVAARYGATLPERSAFGFRDRREAVIGASYYAAEHRLKIQADGRRVRDLSRGRLGYEFRTQVQAVF